MTKVRWRSGNAAVCKTAMSGFDSRAHLQRLFRRSRLEAPVGDDTFPVAPPNFRSKSANLNKILLVEASVPGKTSISKTQSLRAPSNPARFSFGAALQASRPRGRAIASSPQRRRRRYSGGLHQFRG
jgi:hypothetical protein